MPRCSPARRRRSSPRDRTQAASLVIVTSLLACLWVVFTASLAWAAPPSEAGENGSGEAQTEPEAHAEQAKIDDLRRRASGITALIAGELEPQVDVEALLSIDLREPEGGQLQAMLEAVNEARVARVAAEQAAEQAAEAAPNKRRRKPRKPRKPPEPEPEPVAELQPPPLPEPDADPLAWAQAELVRAHWQFWILPGPERAAVIAAHRAKQRAIVEDREAETMANERLDRLQRESRQLAALIAGDLDVSVDPTPLLHVRLSAAGELASDDRLGRALGRNQADAEPEPEPQPGEQGQGGAPESWRPAPDLAAQLETAAAELDIQRLRFSALTLDQRRTLLESHAARQREAEVRAQAAELDVELETVEAFDAEVEEDMTEAVDKAAQAKREREQAQVAAGRARSEALRRVAEERARLLGVKEAHAVYEVELTKRRRETSAAQEVALEWDRRVSELAQTRASEAREAQADAMYVDLRKALANAREHLRGTLRSIASSESGVAPVGEALAGLPTEVERSELSELRAELEASEQSLRELERDVVWAAADGSRDDSVMLNLARLTLLDLASSDLRSRMTGFGSDGVMQVRRELEQIVLELRYRVLSLPRLGRGLLEDLESSPLPLLFALVQLGFAILVFRYWRKQAQPTLERMRDNLLARERGNARINSGLALGLWYFERIRGPLEWLALFAVVFRFLLADGGVLEIEVLWLVVLWLNLGYTVILFVDAVAAHESLVYGRGTSATAQLRIRSLRLVGLTVVLTGLILSMTEETVGRGAIHKWVRSSVWIAAIPILLVLIRWWRDYVFERVRNDKELPDNLLVRWIRANTEGWASFPAATSAGAYLFGRGLMRWLLRRATSFEITRRLLAWMFRREVARQASARQANEQPVRRLAATDYPEFEPARVVESVNELSEPMQAIAANILAEIIALKTTQRGTFSAVIGERGSGKSTFLRRLAAALEASDYAHETAADGEDPAKGERHEEFGRLTIRRIQCPPGGFNRLQRAIAEAVGLPRTAGREQIVEALSQQTPLVFLIDDAHRLVRPAIGGLAGLDQFTAFAREVSGDTSWISSIGAAAWQYMSRSRGDRVFFDQVLKLPAWNEQQIGALIRERCAAAGLTPNFGDIVIPRQFDVSTVAEGEGRPTEEQRAELGYYRILWDYAKGNPGVAIHFWRESLWITTDDEHVRVRLFKEPPIPALDEVGATMHFVLRGVIQLEVASPADLVACTQLPPADVADALRFALARGWVDRVGSYGDRYRVTWHWYRPITHMLRRQHLLEM